MAVNEKSKKMAGVELVGDKWLLLFYYLRIVFYIY
jgi:hypothetical protein